MEPLVAAEGLTKDYGARVVLTGVDFTVGAGEIVGLLYARTRETLAAARHPLPGQAA